MEDEAIIMLYRERNEEAIRETAQKYGHYLNRIAFNILADHEDSEECVNDGYYTAWKRIPPEQPQVFPAFLGKIVRQRAIDLLRRRERQKRGGGEYALSLSELEDCVSGEDDIGQEADLKELASAISAFLRTLSPKNRNLFVYRYYHMEALKDAAAHCGMKESRAKSALFRIRKELKTYLEKEGFDL